MKSALTRRIAKNIIEILVLGLMAFFIAPLLLVLLNAAKSHNEVIHTPLALPKNLGDIMDQHHLNLEQR